jgi:hypothetical protein
VRPLSGAQTGGRPAFTVTNATAQGSAGALTYEFEISASASFTPMLVTAMVPETAAQTTFTPPQPVVLCQHRRHLVRRGGRVDLSRRRLM